MRFNAKEVLISIKVYTLPNRKSNKGDESGDKIPVASSDGIFRCAKRVPILFFEIFVDYL